VQVLLERLCDAGFRVRLYDLTTDLDIPVVMALLWSGRPQNFFDAASGVCAHPSSERAVAGAIQEAAQTRVSNIAGARDDIDPSEYQRPIPSWIANLVQSDLAPVRCPPPSSAASQFAELPCRMGGRVVAVTLSQPDAPVQVVKVLSETMEDRSTNVHWRPGFRALRAMTVL
jgi:ribosomal protein S12 methylthiotransferase accessory factor